MPLPPELRIQILKAVLYRPRGATFRDIVDGISYEIDEHRLQYWITFLVSAGALEIDDTERPRRYFGTEQAAASLSAPTAATSSSRSAPSAVPPPDLASGASSGIASGSVSGPASGPANDRVADPTSGAGAVSVSGSVSGPVSGAAAASSADFVRGSVPGLASPPAATPGRHTPGTIDADQGVSASSGTAIVVAASPGVASDAASGAVTGAQSSVDAGAAPGAGSAITPGAASGAVSGSVSGSASGMRAGVQPGVACDFASGPVPGAGATPIVAAGPVGGSRATAVDYHQLFDLCIVPIVKDRMQRLGAVNYLQEIGRAYLPPRQVGSFVDFGLDQLRQLTLADALESGLVAEQYWVWRRAYFPEPAPSSGAVSAAVPSPAPMTSAASPNSAAGTSSAPAAVSNPPESSAQVDSLAGSRSTPADATLWSGTFRVGLGLLNRGAGQLLEFVSWMVDVGVRLVTWRRFLIASAAACVTSLARSGLSQIPYAGPYAIWFLYAIPWLVFVTLDRRQEGRRVTVQEGGFVLFGGILLSLVTVTLVFDAMPKAVAAATRAWQQSASSPAPGPTPPSGLRAVTPPPPPSNPAPTSDMPAASAHATPAPVSTAIAAPATSPAPSSPRVNVRSESAEGTRTIPPVSTAAENTPTPIPPPTAPPPDTRPTPRPEPDRSPALAEAPAPGTPPLDPTSPAPVSAADPTSAPPSGSPAASTIVGPKSAITQLPMVLGAYLFAGGEWRRLTPSETRVVGAARPVDLATLRAGSADPHRELGRLVMEGPPPPAYPRHSALRLAVVTSPSAAADRIASPVLMPTTTAADSTREVVLTPSVRGIVPRQYVPVLTTDPRPGLMLLSDPQPLPAGTYAVAFDGDVWEFEVKP